VFFLRLNHTFWVNCALVVLSTGISIYGIEISLAILNAPAMVETAASAGVVGDRRGKLEFVRDMRGQGLSMYPSPISPWSAERRPDGSLRSRITIEGSEAVPLGGISNSRTVLCNETGEYLTYNSDEHGFHNPKGLWGSPRLNVAVIGDSFVHGQCVPSDSNIVGRIREKFPATISLGMAGTGPLFYLATLQEYAVSLRPNRVVWVHFEGNDLIDLRIEKASPLLMKYLNEDFSQGLLAKQEQIDQALVSIVENALEASKVRKGPDWVQTGKDVITLHNLKSRLSSLLARGPSIPKKEDMDLFRRIMSKAKTTVGTWGGKLYFVYLPSWECAQDPLPRSFRRCSAVHDQVLAEVHALGIPVVDVILAFHSQGDPSGLFNFPGPHYNPLGYQIAAQAILESLSVETMMSGSQPEGTGDNRVLSHQQGKN
jgi:hypothetical protein